MTTRKEMTRINRIVEQIEKNSPISRVKLIMACGISVSYFDKLKPFILELYPHKVRFDAETKLWYKMESGEIMSTLENAEQTA